MIVYGYIALRQFPKSEKNGLASEIRSTLWSIQRLIIKAIKRYHKKTVLGDLDEEVELLKRQVRIAKEMRFIDIKKYHQWISYLVEMGKMIGGWIKSVRAEDAAKKAGSL